MLFGWAVNKGLLDAAAGAAAAGAGVTFFFDD
jgi:hypothetical protein